MSRRKLNKIKSKKVSLNCDISLSYLEVKNENIYRIGSDICAMHNLKILRLTECRLAMVLPELGLLSLTKLDLGYNSLSLSNNWNWLKGKPLMDSLLELDLSGNQLKFFPPQLVKYDNLESLSLRRNQIRQLPFGIRRMVSLRKFDISRNSLNSLPSTIMEMDLNSVDTYCNNFLPRMEHQILSAVSGNTDKTKFINGIIGIAPPLWLQAVRVISSKKLNFSYKTLPSTLVDLILELPHCLCGKPCDTSIVYERAIKATYPKYVHFDIVLCGKYCEGIDHMLGLAANEKTN